MDDDRIKHWDGPGLDAWRPWTPVEAAGLLADLSASWCVVGGWALELALNRPYRSHEDIEIAIPRADFPGVRDHLRAFKLHVVGDGEVRELPAGGIPAADKHQNWVLDPVINAWRMDVMLEPGDADTWIFRRNERIRTPRSHIVALRDGIPYLRPEGVLLFKAKLSRDKDELDFRTCLPLLSTDARTWLAQALEIAHPGHRWIGRLA